MDEEPDLDQSFNVSTIKELIRSALDGGRSVRDLAEDSGRRVKFQTFQQLSNSPPKEFPKPRTITGMALALKVSETAIVLAYAKSLGITVTTGSNLALRMPADVDKLSPDMQDAIVAVARAALKSGRPGVNGSELYPPRLPGWQSPPRRATGREGRQARIAAPSVPRRSSCSARHAT